MKTNLRFKPGVDVYAETWDVDSNMENVNPGYACIVTGVPVIVDEWEPDALDVGILNDLDQRIIVWPGDYLVTFAPSDGDAVTRVIRPQDFNHIFE